MKALKIVLVVTLSIALIILGVLAWGGLFRKITVVEKDAGGYIVVGTDFTGEYSQVMKPMMVVDSILRSKGIICEMGFGIYYDDPKQVAKDKCRSFVGNIISGKDFDKLMLIKELGLKLDTIEVKKSIFIEFPSPNSLSYMIGPAKVYPAFTEYMKTHTIKPMLSVEIYDMPNKMTYYIMQVE